MRPLVIPLIDGPAVLVQIGVGHAKSLESKIQRDRGALEEPVTLYALLDTGASHVYLTPEICRKLRLPLGSEAKIRTLTAGGSAYLSSSYLASVWIASRPEYRRNDIVVRSLDLGIFRGQNIEALLGMNFLRHFEFKFSREDQHFVFDPING